MDSGVNLATRALLVTMVLTAIASSCSTSADDAEEVGSSQSDTTIEETTITTEETTTTIEETTLTIEETTTTIEETTTTDETTTTTEGEVFEVAVGDYRLFRGFPQDVSCTFEVEIVNLGPGEATDVGVIVDIETPTPGELSVIGMEIEQTSPIPPGGSQLFARRLGINMQNPVPYFVSGHVELKGAKGIDFGDPTSISCTDEYQSP